MSIQDAGNLRIGERVTWFGEIGGRISEIIMGWQPNLVVIEWDDGTQSTIGQRCTEETWSHIEKVQPK